MPYNNKKLLIKEYLEVNRELQGMDQAIKYKKISLEIIFDKKSHNPLIKTIEH